MGRIKNVFNKFFEFKKTKTTTKIKTNKNIIKVNI